MSSHVESIKIYLAIFAALLIGTLLTVLVAFVDLGVFNNVIAITIACLKALLVILYFMHVRHTSRLTWIFVATGFVWLVILFMLLLPDYFTRGGWNAPPTF